MAGLKAAEWALDVEGSAEVATESRVGKVGEGQPAVMNDLGGLVRKKRKAGEDGGVSSVATAQVGSEAKPDSNGVNVLVGRKKSKA